MEDLRGMRSHNQRIKVIMRQPQNTEEAMVLLAKHNESIGDWDRAADWWEHLARRANNDMAREYRIQRAHECRNGLRR